MTEEKLITEAEIENIEKILNSQIESDEDYLKLGELIDDDIHTLTGGEDENPAME